MPLKTGRLIPDRGWVASDYIGIDQGPILTMIANYRSEFVWKVMRQNPYIRKGLERAGFTGGWLAPPDGPQTSGEPDPEAADASDIGKAQSRSSSREDDKPPAEPRASDPPQ